MENGASITCYVESTLNKFFFLKGFINGVNWFLAMTYSDSQGVCVHSMSYLGGGH